MLKLKKIDLLTKNDKIHNKSEHGCCDHKSYRKMTFVEKRGVFLGGGCLQLGRGELGWGRWRNKRGESRQSGDILTLTKGITDEILISVISSVIVMVN